MRINNLRTRHIGPVDLTVNGNEGVGLSGPSGAGKSLLLRAIADLDPHHGEIFLDDRECHAFAAPDWRRQVALLPAESQWWADTVGAHFGDVEPSLLDTLGFQPDVLRWEISRLSTGERQRLAVARLLCNRPQVLLLDEPTASLDPHNTACVEALINGYRERHRAGVIWVSHDPDQLRRIGHRRYHVTDGKLTDGTPAWS